MKTFSPLCTVWQQHVKEFFTGLHGHQSKTLALFVFGSIKANSIVIQRGACALLAESEASVTSIERRLQRFLSNARIDTEQTWDDFLRQIMPYFQHEPMRLVIDLTPYEEHAEAHLHRLVTTVTRLAVGVEGDAWTNQMGSGLMGLY